LKRGRWGLAQREKVNRRRNGGRSSPKKKRASLVVRFVYRELPQERHWKEKKVGKGRAHHYRNSRGKLRKVARNGRKSCDTARRSLKKSSKLWWGESQKTRKDEITNQ